MKQCPKILYFFLFIVSVFIQTFDAKATVVINEIMYHPAVFRDDIEFVELYNPTTTLQDISQWRLASAVRYVFPPNTKLEANSYLIISTSPAEFLDITESSYGPFEGQLSNGDETIRLIDSQGNEIDEVSYVDEGGWPIEADGEGASIERIHAGMNPSHPASWKAGAVGGSPGQKNLNAIPDALPIITNVIQAPVIPKSNQPVQIVCEIDHATPVQEVLIFYKTEEMNYFETVELFDDGQNEDFAANDNVYGGLIPPQPDQSVVEFYIQAQEKANVNGLFPQSVLDSVSLYRVDNSDIDSPLPLYRVIMRDRDERNLRTRGSQSNVELPASFVFGDTIFYNVGIRFRGKGSRGSEPKSYRINFANGPFFGSVRKLNLNAVNPHRQFVGLEILELLNLPTPQKQLVSLKFNNAYAPNYIQVERTDKQMMEREFHDGDGNLYRGVEQANLDYRGEDPNQYRSHYDKITNEVEDDFTDIIQLCAAFSNPPTSDDQFVQQLSQTIDIHQWMRWLAAKKVLNDQEGGLSKERGDDYYMYNNPANQLFYLLPWDLDSVFQSPLLPVHHHDGTAIQNTVGRFLRHPDLASQYFSQIVSILETELPQSTVDLIIDKTSPITSEAVRDEMKQFSLIHREFLLSQIPRELTAEISRDLERAIIQEGDEWAYFKGIENPPSNWNEPTFDDSTWDRGPGGIGYGDNDDQTELLDMRNNYPTVFMRKQFSINSPGAISRLALEVNYDDAFVAYLNGVEIARSNFIGEPNSFSTASSNHEAGSFETFEINNAAELLMSGANTLAIVGLNVSLNSSDFSSTARLNAITQEGESVVLRGFADVTQTRWVRVNGDQVLYEPWKGEWSYLVDSTLNQTQFEIEAFDINGTLIDSKTIQFTPPPVSHGGEIVQNTTWTKEMSPINVDDHVVVLENVTLTIEPGVDVQLAAGKGIVVFGTLKVNGVLNEPVRFSSKTADENWGGIAFNSTSLNSSIQFANFYDSGSFSYQGSQFNGAVSINECEAEILDSGFFAIDTLGVNAVRARLHVARCTFESMGEMIHCSNSFSIIEHNRFDTIFGHNDAIDFDGQSDEPSIIRSNVILNSEDDGLDMGGGASPIIEGNWIQNCADKGISLESDSTPFLANNVIVNCGIGVTSGDSARMTFIHNTVVNCQTGIELVEKTTNGGGGEAVIINSILWNTTQSLVIDEKSNAVIQSSNLMQLPAMYAQNNFSIDPLFVGSNNDDYALKDQSPLIDAGEPSSVLTDFNGALRPMGAAPDLGAFENTDPTMIYDWGLMR
ncbi:MAG: CotH kinase family protein [Candidatus Hinthialibacter antarcticus]|nr:CotH kinase family protein [Candidatus Hinthialibacter antarcticus]